MVSEARLIPEPSVITAASLASCDREPIHVPGAIQPHGLLLVADAASLVVVAGAGELETRLRPEWLGHALSVVLGRDLARMLAEVQPGPGGLLHLTGLRGPMETFDASLHRSGPFIVVELEPASPEVMSATETLLSLDRAATAFERASSLASLCDHAALTFRQITGFDRVMIYRFLDDGSGAVIAEARDPGLPSFLNHHFPASDVPQQARRLYIRNRVRVIPDVHYTPAPLRTASGTMADLDMSDLTLRSVSPIHLQYMRNMGLDASASISIVQDGVLWGLIACHNRRPRGMSYEARAACRALAGGLARQIRAREEAEIYREQLRLRSAEDAVLARLGRQGVTAEVMQDLSGDLMQMLGASGFLALMADGHASAGHVPDRQYWPGLVERVRHHGAQTPFRSHELARQHAPARDFTAIGSGLLAIPLGGALEGTLLWFRAEKVELVNWAGNPHKGVDLPPGAMLTPRASFADWHETVRGRSEPWSLADVAAAVRLRDGIADTYRQRELMRLNQELDSALRERDHLLLQKDYLMREVNHRVQNSLQLVSSYMALQAHENDDARLTAYLSEARRRLAAVSLVHRRLYRDEQMETVDLGRYLNELCNDLAQSMGDGWVRQMRVDLAPVLMSADRSIHLGLILTELVINAGKYAYDGAEGPISISVEQHGSRIRLVVADQGTGSVKPGKGFGSSMIEMLTSGLDGELEFAPNHPGLRAIVMVPIDALA
ncbi:GAF domain-containing protein [Pseudoroseomonas wenyumeiae]|uniref:histidine kinase n=1 Tax=Teichococcus wenyumeiae TaxID=2478470 RepID=A0A3A9JQ30_9PROT|nr:histidine kinase dimerization/phosphoacceptor domain -containing protein [Pseudoroseomonas wenyumeiae]RKK06026.1 GAF domain-containing protein [Pseudoroseomonas wenyumeiae]RMI19543.1 GAF domain-containing protein [Pseudoroseomonas wenyumeiae]